MLNRKKIGKRILYVLAFIVLLLIIVAIYMVQVSKVPNPTVADMSSLQLQRIQVSNNFYTLNNSWFKKSKSGLYELYVEGDGFNSGVINGKLTKELVVRQEDNFILRYT